MKLGMLMLQDMQGDVKNVIKIGGHRACFRPTMLTNTVIRVTFCDLRAQQLLYARLFSNAACDITQNSTFFDCSFSDVPEKWLQMNCIIN